MRYKGVFRIIAMAPILVPSLLPGIALVCLLGNQGMLKGLLMGQSIYGPIGRLFPAAFVVFNLVITDFSLPKVISGQYNMLAVDIYRQMIGQQNFEMGLILVCQYAAPIKFWPYDLSLGLANYNFEVMDGGGWVFL